MLKICFQILSRSFWRRQNRAQLRENNCSPDNLILTCYSVTFLITHHRHLFLILTSAQTRVAVRILQVQEGCYCWISCCLPEGEVFIWDFREQEPFHNLNYHKVNLQRSARVVLRLLGKQLWPKSCAETKLNCHQCLSVNDSSERESSDNWLFEESEKGFESWTNKAFSRLNFHLQFIRTVFVFPPSFSHTRICMHLYVYKCTYPYICIPICTIEKVFFSRQQLP